ncbi:MAG: phospho-N-acetylmuramoyl-pentapeptide-transferase [Calditrichaeota bacterium]|nr:phospho-N-acetylmuramoyl-pentapeptide-transferase [Calditrichota bacterium]MCB9391063.1 phospho-N-acetylmuramoyl-pentapeptide-transferase [Calditrichota bacterium]
MLYHLLVPLRDHLIGANLFRYLTFRSALAAVLGLVLSFVFGPWLIRKLKEHQIGEEIRTDGPQTHLSKKGTPTMGGLMILFCVAVPTLLLANLTNFYVLLTLLSFLWMGAIGFYDDYLKVVKKKKAGLVARSKLIGQVGLSLIIGLFLLNYSHLFGQNFHHHVTQTTLPFVKQAMLDFGWLFPVMVVIVITGTSNGVNLTDGLDGLAIGVTSISAAAFAVMCYVTGNVRFSEYLNIIYLDGAGELTIFCSALLGAGLGFLWYNGFPASVFMGDTGALALGGALGTLAVLIKKEFFLLVIGGIFVAEALSVMMQRGYFKYTKRRYGEGRRIFRMAPLHHHFEQLGWHESKVVVRFWVVQVLLVLISLTMFKVR